MKKNKNKIWIGVLTLLIVFAGFSVMSSATSAACNVVIDGTAVEFTADSGAPFIDKNNRTLVPLRVTMETYGCVVDWNQTTRTASVEMDGTTVLVGIGNSYITVDGEKIAIDTAAQIVNNRTYLPIRAVLEAFGAEVNWIHSTRTVDVMSPAYISEEYKIIPSVTEVNVDLYNCVEIPVKVISDKTVLAELSVDDTSIADVEWTESDYADDMILMVVPENPGTTTVHIDLPDIPNVPSVSIKINVTKPAVKPQPYADYPDVPDFGRYFGVSPILDQQGVQDGYIMQVYAYDVTSLDHDKYVPGINAVYQLILEKAGFEYFDSELSSDGKRVDGSYINEKTGQILMIREEIYSNGTHSFIVYFTI